MIRVKQFLINHLSDRMFVYLLYFKTKRKLLHLRNPKTFCEKLQWMKINGNLDQCASFVDKFEVRKYVTNVIGTDYLVPLLGHWDNLKDIPFKSLPKKFVLKATHGCDYNYICNDKSNINTELLEITFSVWLAENFYKVYREPQYKNCKSQIICEQYLEDEYGELRDYKILCFNGMPRVIEVHTARFSGHTGDYFDTSWNKIDWEIGYTNFPGNIAKPKNLSEMLDVAKKLSNGFPFVRVDLYSVRQKIYFGELTFTPGNGLSYFGKADTELGRMFDLSGYQGSSSKLLLITDSSRIVF